MKCRKCGSEIADNSIRCVHCGIKVNVVCPSCNTLNLFGTRVCSSCGFELIKICPECSAPNLYQEKECRKCHHPFVENEPEKAEIQQSEIDVAVEAEKVEQPADNTIENPDEQNLEHESPIENESITADSVEIAEEENIEEDTNVVSADDNSVTDESDEILPAPEMPQIEEEEQTDNQSKENEHVSSYTTGEFNGYINSEKYIQKKSSTENTGEEIPSVDKEIKHKYFNVEVPLEPETDEENKLIYQPKKQEKEVDIDEIINSSNVDEIDETVDDVVANSIQEEQSIAVEEEEDLIKTDIQSESERKLTNLIKNSLTKHIIALTGEEGCGKTAVLRQFEYNLKDKGYIFLYGSCTPLVQITSFGFFQDAFLRIMGFPPFTKSFESFVKDFKKSNLHTLFDFLDSKELNSFLNIFYPSKIDNYENIQSNKQEMFSILEKVIKSFSVNNNLVIVIDNFDLLDGASYEFIVNMLDKGYFTTRVKLLASYQEDKHIQSYFDLTKTDDKIFETIRLGKLPPDEMIRAVEYSLGLKISNILSPDYISELVQKADGNAIRLEEEIALLFDSGYISVNDNEILINDENKPEIPPSTFEELVKFRLNSLAPSAKNILYIAAIMGYRFSQAILTMVAPMDSAKAEHSIEYLKQELFIVPVDNYTCEFKSLTIWKLIYQEAKNDILYKENATKLYDVLKPLILSSNLQKLISCTEAISKNEAFYIWQNTASLSSKLGDTNLFVIAQKQCLKILEEEEFPNGDDLRAKIYEKLGKILCEKSPKEAVTYLSNVLDLEIKNLNLIKIIDLSAYFVKSCYLCGNYFGAVEAVDAIITNINLADIDVSETDIALIKTRKLKALLNIGNSEQIVNLVNEEITAEIEKELNNKKPMGKWKSLVVDSWLLSKTVLAKAYAMQGNNESFNVIAQIREFLDKNEYSKDYYSVQTDLIEAFAYTISGNINKSNDILNSVVKEYGEKTMETDLLSDWNLINIINRVFLDQIYDLKSDLFELATFTNNINEHFTKNIVKLILAYVLKAEGNIEKAKEIIDEQTTYFAKEKVSIGFLLSWLMLVQLTIESGDDEKALTTATKSLEIAQSPKINNYIFTIYFQKILSEIYLRKGDLTAAKMYIEKSVVIAKQFNLKYQLIELYLSYGEYMQELMRLSKNYSPQNVSLTSELYNKAVLAAKELKLENLTEKTVRARSDFKAFCQLNNVEV